MLDRLALVGVLKFAVVSAAGLDKVSSRLIFTIVSCGSVAEESSSSSFSKVWFLVTRDTSSAS